MLKNITLNIVLFSGYLNSFGALLDDFTDRNCSFDYNNPTSFTGTDFTFQGSIDNLDSNSGAISFPPSNEDSNQTYIKYTGNTTGTLMYLSNYNPCNLSNDLRCVLNVISCNTSTNCQVMLYSPGSGNVRYLTKVIPMTNSPTQMTFDLSQASSPTHQSGNFDPTQVNQILVSLSSSSPSTLYLDSIELVPEPFSVITMGVGLAALIRKRKQIFKNRKL